MRVKNESYLLLYYAKTLWFRDENESPTTGQTIIFCLPSTIWRIRCASGEGERPLDFLLRWAEGAGKVDPSDARVILD
jgi:hypothetical protein